MDQATLVWRQTSIVMDMFHSLKLRKLELTHVDAKLFFFYKIHHGLVALPKEEELCDTSPEYHAISCVTSKSQQLQITINSLP
jgi:hypothetical protein